MPDPVRGSAHQCRTNSQSEGARVGPGESGDEPVRTAPTWFVQVRYGAEASAGSGHACPARRWPPCPRRMFRTCAVAVTVRRHKSAISSIAGARGLSPTLGGGLEREPAVGWRRCSGRGPQERSGVCDPDRMTEIAGDSSRDGCWALVRLRIEGERIVDADADGSGHRPARTELDGGSGRRGRDAGSGRPRECDRAGLRGAVLAGPGRGGDERRRRLGRGAPSGRLRTRSASRSACGPIRRGPSSERACCSPAAVIAATGDVPLTRGVPHVTLDLREAFRRAVVEPFVRGYARGETPNPCTRCNGGFRFAQLLSFARRAGAAPARDRALRAGRRASRPSG